jgi:signal transduction histidine kinase
MPSPELPHAEMRAAIADVDRLIGIFNALLRLAEIDSGARRAGFASVDLAPLLTQVAEVYAALAEDTGTTLTVDAPPSLAATGDPAMLAQAVGNLIDNAVKYAPGGHITLSLKCRDDRRVTVTVADDGPGIPESERARVIERFYRGDASRGSPGIGLGLAEVAAVAKLHGGALELGDNHPGLAATLVLGEAIG